MRIRVRVENELLGNSTFWEGEGEDFAEIRNIVARRLAEQTAQDGAPRKDGMWVVEPVNSRDMKR